MAYRPNLIRTLTTALIVGVILFLLNHLASVLAGHADTATWLETAVSFVVPFCVSNIGVLIASRRSTEPSGATPAPVGRPAPTWERLSQCPRCVVHPPHLARTTGVALVVGTLYFVINQLSVVLAGHADTVVWAAAGLTYLVPFSVSNLGVLIGSRREHATWA